jgi:hypothetical protein
MITTVKPVVLGGWNKFCINSLISFKSSSSKICLAPFDDISKKSPWDNRPRAPQNFSPAYRQAGASATRPSRKFRDPCLHAVVQLAYRHAHMLNAFRHAGVAFRPTITRGLALSANVYKYNSSIIFSSNFNAKTE